MMTKKEAFLHMRIHRDVKDQMRQCAQSVGLSMSTWADQVLRNAINEHRRDQAATGTGPGHTVNGS